MRQLSERELETLHRRRSTFKEFVEESLPVLSEFLRQLGVPNPETIAQNAEPFLPVIDSWLKGKELNNEDRIWALTRIGYFLGTLLCQKYRGRWLLEENPSSPYFLEYVVGDFSLLPIQQSRVSPFAVANNYINEPPGNRSLTAAFAKIQEGLRSIIEADPEHN